MDSPELMACIGVGSNIEPREVHMASAFDAIRSHPHLRLVSVSTLHETEPVGPVPQAHFLNAAATIATRLHPRQLLDALLGIERSLGRDRHHSPRWGPRTIDLDLLLYSDLIINEPDLVVPHPRMAERSFVLVPLAEIAPDRIVPGTQRTVRDLLNRQRSATTDLCGDTP